MRRLLPALVALTLAGPAVAVGLGPLSKQGVTDGPAKGFYLTLINPYAERAQFAVYAIGPNDDVIQRRVEVPVGPIALRAKTTRKFMIVAGELTPGETYAFRVCAERVTQEEAPIHARVCSRITARRLAGPGVADAGVRQ